jgi:hypothetical protein
MTKRFQRVRAILDEVVAHVKESNDSSGSISVYLAQYIVIVFHSEVESEVKSTIERLLSQSSDSLTAVLLKDSLKCLIRSYEKGELAGFVGRFGDTPKRIFNEKTDDRITQIYNNGIKARHKVAHAIGQPLTLGDVSSAIDCAESILASFEDALVDVFVPSKRSTASVGLPSS